MKARKGVSRRTVLKGALAGAATGIAGFPFISYGQSEVIRIGHLTPRTGFLGPLGEFAVQAVDLAVAEINAAGGIGGRPIKLVHGDSKEHPGEASEGCIILPRDIRERLSTSRDRLLVVVSGNPLRAAA